MTNWPPVSGQFYIDAAVAIYCRDALEFLRQLPAEIFQTVITSPPYWGLRDYGVPGQIGLEPTLEEYVTRMVEVFQEVRRVLRPDGTLWLNLGDTYGGAPSGGQGLTGLRADRGFTGKTPLTITGTLKPKDLAGIPWRVALALQADGWYLRADIIWHKTNPAPETVRDRTTRAHEYIFLLTKNAKYFYDYKAISEPASPNTHDRVSRRAAAAKKAPSGWDTEPGSHKRIHRDGRATGAGPKASDRSTGVKYNTDFAESVCLTVERRNKRSVWSMPTQAFPEAHFATFPENLIKPCVLAGSRPGDVILDPFGGAGTVARVGKDFGRQVVLVELNPNYCAIARKRVAQEVLALS